MGGIKAIWVMSFLLAEPILAQLPVPIGDEFRVNTYTTNSQKLAAVAVAPDGAFVVVWTSEGIDGDLDGIRGQRFAPSGDRLGGEFQVNSYTTNVQRVPDVALDAVGNFVVVWYSGGQSGSGYSVHGQRFDADGTDLGDEFWVDSSDPQAHPAVAVAPDGAFVVVWQTSRRESSIRGQRFDAAGSPQGAEMHVSSVNTDDHELAAVAMHPAGDFVTVWHSWSQDGSKYGVYGQSWALALFADGFESGDTSAWSSTTP